MKRVIFISTIFCLISIFSFGQTDKKNYFPIWTYHQKNINIHGLSIGLATGMYKTRFTNTNGIKLELIGLGFLCPLFPRSPVSKNEDEFQSLLNEPRSERINGLNVSATGSLCDCKINGISLGTFAQYNYQINGISGACLMNFAQIHNGLQFAGITWTYKMNGLQIGIRNYSLETNGVQLGLFNISNKLKGMQIGLWNRNQKRKLPIINWNFSDN